MLAHLERHRPVSPAELAAHLGVVPSTLSATLKRLGKLGYLSRFPGKLDRRRVELLLTAKGARAMQATSVLETARVRKLLRRLTPEERQRACEGLRLLAKAASEVMANQSKQNQRG